MMRPPPIWSRARKQAVSCYLPLTRIPFDNRNNRSLTVVALSFAARAHYRLRALVLSGFLLGGFRGGLVVGAGTLEHREHAVIPLVAGELVERLGALLHWHG